MTAPDPFNPLPNETSKAYAAFQVYRDLGAGRSLAAAYEQSTQKVGRANKVWGDWSAKYHWVERAKAYDAYLANKARLQREDEHARELAEYREQLAKSSRAALVAGQRALKIALDKLERMNHSDVQVKSLPALIRAANDTIEKAMDGWGAALAVDDLMEALNVDD